MLGVRLVELTDDVVNQKRQGTFNNNQTPTRAQHRSQGLSSLPPLVVGTETLVAAGRVTTQNVGGRKICRKGGVFYHPFIILRPNVREYPPTLRFWMNRWSRDQPQPGSLFQRLREAENRDPGNEVDTG